MTRWFVGALIATVLLIGGYLLASGVVELPWHEKSNEAIWGTTPTEVASHESKASVQEALPQAPPPPQPASTPEDSKHEARGVVRAAETATLGSRITASISSIPFRVGSKFERGAVLVQLDCRYLEAELKAANAASVAYRKSYETNLELDQYEAIGKNEVAVSQANLNKAEAEAASVSAQLEGCEIRAPFDGTVVEEIAHRGEIAASGQPLIKLQSGGELEAELIVPSTWLTWIKPGVEFGFVIDETGEQVLGVVRRLGASVNPVSKTIRVIGNLFPRDELVLPGMSGTALFEELEQDKAAGAPNGGKNGRGGSDYQAP
ncbi:efflux RND transporter periplasmic adaptor subunit [Pseudomonas sp. M30-35]|uniref:efflux RND transporter periplasmic adaptor subunit n=1 Tax=Pseudomonas sp. M30-35 TaxID=1981174 RepID=UPI0012FE44CC|nr:efflux RND transporter periplasmic adaptor subunit [Pseudomonas sp. M30-35]